MVEKNQGRRIQDSPKQVQRQSNGTIACLVCGKGRELNALNQSQTSWILLGRLLKQHCNSPPNWPRASQSDSIPQGVSRPAALFSSSSFGAGAAPWVVQRRLPGSQGIVPVVMVFWWPEVEKRLEKTEVKKYDDVPLGDFFRSPWSTEKQPTIDFFNPPGPLWAAPPLPTARNTANRIGGRSLLQKCVTT